MIAIFGAGAIGCWVGARLAAGGTAVTLIGRSRVMAEVAGGVTASELGTGGATVRATPRTTTDPAAAATAQVVLVSVKSPQTADAGAQLARVLRPGTTVVSLQNGVRNAATLRAALPQCHVLAAMVPFNVVRQAPGHYHRASSGELHVDDRREASPLVVACRAARLPLVTRADMPAVQWAKLLMNLNNAINALSGLPLATELAQRAYRRCLAASQREALGLLAQARQSLAKLTPLSPPWMPRVLELPDPVFRLLARRIVAIDAQARSSMWDDFEARRPTEIDFLQGEIVELARRLGQPAPVNGAIVELVRRAEGGGRRDYTGPQLAAALGC